LTQLTDNASLNTTFAYDLTETPAINTSIDGAYMSTALWLIIRWSGVATASVLFKKWKLPRLPDVTDDQFLRLHKIRFDTSENRIW